MLEFFNLFMHDLETFLTTISVVVILVLYVVLITVMIKG